MKKLFLVMAAMSAIIAAAWAYLIVRLVIAITKFLIAHSA